MQTHRNRLRSLFRSLQTLQLTLRITDQNNNVITDGLQVTVVLHIHDRKNIIPYQKWNTEND